MKTDGQLYESQKTTPPPMLPPKHDIATGSINKDTLLVMGLIFLLLTDKTKPDLPLIAALIYILL